MAIRSVNVTVNRLAPATTQAGFGLPLIQSTEDVRAYEEYNSITEFAVDYPSTTRAFDMATAIFAQGLSTVAAFGVDFTQSVTATLDTSFVASNSNLTFTSKVEGADGNFIEIVLLNTASSVVNTTAVRSGAGTSGDPFIITVTLKDDGVDETALASEVEDAIEADADSNAVVRVNKATGNDGTGIVEELSSTPLAGGVDNDPVSDLSAALTTLQQNPDQDEWYFLLNDLQTPIVQVELSGYIAGQKKLYFTDTTDLELTGEFNSARTSILTKNVITDYPASAWVGFGGKFDAGTITWAWKNLNGIAVDNSITNAQNNNLDSDGGNAYTSSLGVPNTTNGLVTNSEFIDVVRTADFLDARIEESITTLLLTSKKVPYTQDGINQVVSVINDVIQPLGATGVLGVDESGNTEFVVDFPNIKNVSQSDKSNRVLNDITATVVIAGAIHIVNVTVNLEL